MTLILIFKDLINWLQNYLHICNVKSTVITCIPLRRILSFLLQDQHFRFQDSLIFKPFTKLSPQWLFSVYGQTHPITLKYSPSKHTSNALCSVIGIFRVRVIFSQVHWMTTNSWSFSVKNTPWVLCLTRDYINANLRIGVNVCSGTRWCIHKLRFQI